MTKITVEAACPKNSMVAIIITGKRKTDRGMLYNGESRTFFIRAGAKVLIQEMPKDDLVELKAKQNSGHWVPEQGEIYYYIDSDLSVSPTDNYNHRHDKNRILVGNCYKTLAEAEKERDRLIAIAEVNQIIREENGCHVVDWNDSNQHKLLLCYDYSDKSLGSSSCAQRKIPSELDFCWGEALIKIISRITQDQINKIWRL